MGQWTVDTKMITKPGDEIMTVAEVADYLRINQRTVYSLAKKGELPGIKLGAQWRFKKEAIDKIFAQRSSAVSETDHGKNDL